MSIDLGYIKGPKGDKGDTGPQGAKGDTGATGNGISSITEYYQVSTSNSTAPTSWSTTVPTLTATNKYLWNYEKITYTNGSSVETKKRVIGVYGDKGATGSTGATGPTGATGQGISNITIEFYLSTSKTTQTGGLWTTTQPTWSPGKYLWTRQKITYKNPTSTAYTTPTCDSSWEAVNEVDVGGRNLFINTSDYREATPFSTTSTKTDNWTSTFDSKHIYSNEKFKAGDVITVQAKSNLPWATKHAGPVNTVGFWLYLGTYSQVTTGDYTFPIFLGGDGSSNEFKKTYTIPAIGDLEDIYIGFRFNSYSDCETSVTAKFWDLKLERGNKPTDWTPAPEDIENELTANYYTKKQTEAAIKVSSDSITQTVETTYTKKDDVSKNVVAMQDQFYLSSSPTALSGGSWSSSSPTWQQGKYIWRRTYITYFDKTTAYTPSANGVCIAGNTGATGPQGPAPTMDSALSTTSTNGVQNKVVTAKLNALETKLKKCIFFE